MKKIMVILILILALLLCPFSVLQADAAYQISIQSNTEYAVFTLSYTGPVTGLKITSPSGVNYDQGSSGNAYKASAGKIQIGVRFAESGKWKILVSGSPDDGFQIMMTSDSSFGDFTGSVPNENSTLQTTPALQTIPTTTPIPILTSTPMPTPTPTSQPPLIPVPTKEETVTSTSPSSTNTPVLPTQKEITSIQTQIPEMGTLTITPTTGTATLSPTITPEATVIKEHEIESSSVPTAKIEATSLEEKYGLNLSSMASTVIRKICILVLVTLLVIGIIWVIAKKRNKIRAIYYQIGIFRSEKKQKKRIYLKQQAAESSRLRAQRQIAADAAQRHARKMKEEAAADAQLIKIKKNDETETVRLHALQVKATLDALRIQRKQEKAEEKNHIRNQRKEKRHASRRLAQQNKANSAELQIQSRQEKFSEKSQLKKKRKEEIAKARLISKHKKEKKAAARIQKHTASVEKDYANRVQKRNPILLRLKQLRTTPPILQTQQELNLRILFESQLEKERVVLFEMEVEAKARAAAIKESRGKQ